MTRFIGGDGRGIARFTGAAIAGVGVGAEISVAGTGSGCSGAGLAVGALIFVCSSSRTESFTIAPQAKQIESVGARLRLQTGQFISL